MHRSFVGDAGVESLSSNSTNRAPGPHQPVATLRGTRGIPGPTYQRAQSTRHLADLCADIAWRHTPLPPQASSPGDGEADVKLISGWLSAQAVIPRPPPESRGCASAPPSPGLVRGRPGSP